MAKLNKVFLMGNLTRDPELRFTPGGSAVVSFGMAMNEKWKGTDGEYQEKVHFVDCSMFGKRAEVINEYFSKSDPIFVEGSLDYHSWKSKDGDNRNALKVKVLNFEFIDGNKNKIQSSAKGDSPDVADEEIPF